MTGVTVPLSSHLQKTQRGEGGGKAERREDEGTGSGIVCLHARLARVTCSVPLCLLASIINMFW